MNQIKHDSAKMFGSRYCWQGGFMCCFLKGGCERTTDGGPTFRLARTLQPGGVILLGADHMTVAQTPEES